MNTLTKDTRIAVLMGGPGSENEVSLASGQGVVEALTSAGYTRVTPLVFKEKDPAIPAGTELCYNIVHGTYGEDGQLQSYLQGLGLAYTGTGIESSRNCFDKVLTKKAMLAEKVPTPACAILAPGQSPSLPIPCVVKPPKEGSSVGVHIVKTAEELAPALADVARYGPEILVEEFISGKELTVGVLDGVALPVVHICPRSGFYDMKNKYPSLYSGGGTDYICPAELNDEQTAAVQAAAIAAYKALKVEVYARVDVLLTDDGKPYVLEINTIPGMTSSSLLPKAAQATGISYAELCVRIAELSLNQTRS